MATLPTSPQDSTGRAAEEAAKKRAKDLEARKDEISLARQAEAESLANDVFDPKAPNKPILIDEVETVGVTVRNEMVTIRTVSDIEDMTYGVINGTPQVYNFKQGAKYQVTRDVAAYLQNLGYLYQIG